MGLISETADIFNGACRATLVFVLIKLILEPRPNIFLIVFVILLCLMFPAGVYHIIFETNYLSPGHGHNHGRHDYDHNSVYEPDYEPVNERRIRERLDREMKKSRSGMPAEQLAFARSAAAAAGYIEPKTRFIVTRYSTSAYCCCCYFNRQERCTLSAVSERVYPVPYIRSSRFSA